jgi:hypothetical protein
MISQEIERPRNDAHAAQTLDDAPFLAYVLVQCAKLFLGLIRKRWPELG